MENLNFLKRLYDQHLREDGSFAGNVVIKFAINETGKVIFAAIVDKTTNNKTFEEEEQSLVKSWNFLEIHNPDDATEVVYPFIFSQ